MALGFVGAQEHPGTLRNYRRSRQTSQRREDDLLCSSWSHILKAQTNRKESEEKEISCNLFQAFKALAPSGLMIISDTNTRAVPDQDSTLLEVREQLLH